MANNAFMPNLNAVIGVGMNPRTGLPLKLDDSGCAIKENIRKQLRIMDEQDAIGRYRWYNLPDGLDSELLERILYYRGQAAMFYMKENNKFYFLPYTLQAINGTGLDVYGRYTGITPLPFNGSTSNKDKSGKETPWIIGLHKIPVYDIGEIENFNESQIEDAAVLLSDYCKQSSQMNISRQILQDPLLDIMAEVFPMARTALIANSGVKAWKVQNEDEYSNVSAANRSIKNASLNGDAMVPVIGMTEFQDLTSAGTALKAEEYLMMLQSFDNYRLSLYGLKSGGLFQKKSHMLDAEADMNNVNNSLVYMDGLRQRQKFCDFCNALWGLGIMCEASETALGMDMNQDGVVEDNQDQTGTDGEQPVVGGSENV